MIRSCGVLVLAVVFQVAFVSAQETEFARGPPPPPLNLQSPSQQRIPRHCWAPPPGIDIYKCCPIPKLYPDEVMESCGIEKPPPNDFQSQPKGPPKNTCKEGLCLMKTANLLIGNTSVDYVKLRAFIDHWADTNPDFTEAILAAKQKCAKDGGPIGGPPVCEQDKIFFCLTTNILWNCKLKDFDGCQILKEHMDECRPYYLKGDEEGTNDEN